MGARGQHVCVVGSGEVSSVLVITYDNAYDTIGWGTCTCRGYGVVWAGVVPSFPVVCDASDASDASEKNDFFVALLWREDFQASTQTKRFVLTINSSPHTSWIL